jgi:hypothetical protein
MKYYALVKLYGIQFSLRIKDIRSFPYPLWG